MRVKLKCPNPECKMPLTLDTDWAGKKGTCANCQKSFKIPENLAQLADQSRTTSGEGKTIDGGLTQSQSSSGEGRSHSGEGRSSERRKATAGDSV